MAAYLVLARKYRSATFEEVVGQEHIATTLTNAITAGRVAHAFLFAGTRGVGKTTVARILAKALNCLSADGPTPTPCNQCDACVAIARGDDIDVVEIDGASNRGIDEIRDLRSNAVYHPARCRYKIYYIDEVHMLTKEAFNALLKTLEEPPAHVKFIFATTEPQRVPATIVSRCQRFDFRNIPTRLIAAHLEAVCKAEKAKVDSGAIFRIARAAAGSMRDGLSLLDQLLSAGGPVAETDVVRVLGTPPDERTSEIVRAMADGAPAGALEALDAVLASGVTVESALRAVGEMFRNMMLALTCGADSELIELPDTQRQEVGDVAVKFSLPAVVQAVGLCQTTSGSLRGLADPRALAEAALVRLAAADKFVDAASLVERLEQLGAGRGAPAAPAPRGATARAPAAARPRYGQKKKPLAPRAAPARGGADPPAGSASSDPPPPAPAPSLENPQWELTYLRENWSGVVGALNAARAGHVAGLLAPAKVAGLEADTLHLGYDGAHEPIRRRASQQDEQIRSALGGLFGQAVRCQYVSTGEPGEAPARAAAPQAASAVSSADREAIRKDPAVQAVLNFFGGAVVDIRRETPEAQPDEP